MHTPYPPRQGGIACPLPSRAAFPVVAAFIALQTAKGQAFFGLLKDARTEIRKVVWPTRQETTQTTLIVVAVVLVMALLLWGLDSLLGWLVSTIVG